MNITQVVPVLKKVSAPATGAVRLAVALLGSELVVRTRDDDIYISIYSVENDGRNRHPIIFGLSSYF